MDEKKYSDFLTGIASQVDSIIAIRANRDIFESRINDFLKRFEKWMSVWQDGINAALKDKKLRIGKGLPDNSDDDILGKWWENAKQNCPEGYEIVKGGDQLYSYYPLALNMSDVNGYYYRLKLSLNPLDTLCQRDDFDDLFVGEGTPLIARKPEDELEDKLRKYFLLAVIHAHEGNSPGLVDKQAPATKIVWNVYGSSNQRDEYHRGKKKRALIKAALSTVETETDLAKSPAETEQNTTPAKEEKANINIQNFRGVLGDVQAENVQTGDHASIHKQPKAENKNEERAKSSIIGWIFKKTSHLICAIVVAVIATIIATIMIDIFADFGWIKRIKEFFIE